MKKVILIVLAAAIALLFLTACEEQSETDMITIPDELPAEVQAWIEAGLEDFGARILEYDGLLYLLVTYGEKPTGGYDVEITDISEKENKLVVTAHFTEPGKDDIVTEALTYPYDLAMLEDPGLPVRFEATGAETEVPAIQ